MGMFFKEKEEVGQEPVKKQDLSHHGFFAAAGLMILAFFLNVLSWGGKPFFTWLFTFQGETPERVRTKVSVIVLLFGGIFFFLYTIPFVRDFVSLSTIHIINVEQKPDRIFFPDRSYFVAESERRIVRFKEQEKFSYLTYGGYKSDTVQTLPQKSCQLVPRSEKIFLATISQKLQAEGFLDEVTFRVTRPFPSASLHRKIREYFSHPGHLLKNSEERRAIMLTYLTTESWKEFEEAILLKTVWSYKEDGAIPFETKARTYEHAIICAF